MAATFCNPRNVKATVVSELVHPVVYDPDVKPVAVFTVVVSCTFDIEKFRDRIARNVVVQVPVGKLERKGRYYHPDEDAAVWLGRYGDAWWKDTFPHLVSTLDSKWEWRWSALKYAERDLGYIAEWASASISQSIAQMLAGE